MRKSSYFSAIFLSALFFMLTCSGMFFSIYLSDKYQHEIDYINSIETDFLTTSNQWNNPNEKENHRKVNSTEYTGHDSTYEYNNINFISYSESWDQQKLSQLAFEMFENVHGDEINYVARVELHDGESESYSGLHTTEYEKFEIPVSYYNVFPDNMTFNVSSKLSIITLTGADVNTTVESMARTLTHEYGHHFTQFYFGFDGTDRDLNTEYFQLRNQPGAPIYSVSPSWEYYLDNHMWHIQELAAEDYVYFMGSDKSHEIVDYYDPNEKVKLYATNKTEYTKLENVNINSLNAYPHENPVLTAPSQVEGLAKLYYKAIGRKPPEYFQTDPVGNLNLSVSNTSKNAYDATWNKPWSDSNVIYTLIVYDQNDVRLYIVKTVYGNEPAIAKMGFRTYSTNQYDYSVDDNLAQLGAVRFRITITFPDGSVVFSDPVDVEF